MTSSPPASSAPPPLLPAPVESTFAGSGGLALFRRVWRPAGPSRGVLVNVHGLGDHGGLYPFLVDHLLHAGWTVHAPDLRGNGRSPGQRGYVARWREFQGDLDRFLAVVRAEEGGDRPIFLLGNSLGGLIVLDYALDHPDACRGFIAAAPPLGQLRIPAYLLVLARLVSRVWPRFSLETGLDLSGLARDAAIAAAIVNDPLFHRRGTARLGTEVEHTIARLQREAPRFTAPFLILHGSADRMVPPDGSRAFFPKAGSRDKQYREYADGYHALFADYGHDEVLRNLEQWIAARS